jgi:hypothetical protein
VAPINALGEGVLSAATVTVVASSGASPLYTTANGSSLYQGITYSVDEEQVITATNCDSTLMALRYGAYSANLTNSQTEAEVEAIFLNTFFTTGIPIISHLYYPLTLLYPLY